jgi:phenylacetate-CoA ligase
VKKAFSKKNLWEKTPAGVKAILGAALSTVPLPYLLGGQFRRWHQFAKEADKWDAEQVLDYQLAQLRRVLTLAYEKTEFYRETFRAVGFQPGDFKKLEDLERLPTIDKATVRENWQRMMTRPMNDPSIDLVTTGGTSGEPMRFYMSSSRHAPEFGHLTACWSRVGYQPGDVFAVLRGRVITKPTNGMYHQYDPLFRYHYYSTFHMSPADLRAYLGHMNRVQPKFLHAYPSSLFALVEFAASEGLSLPKSLRAVLFESEALFPHQRALFQSKLGVRTFSCYGHSEKLVMAAQCESSEEYHVAPSYGYCEVLNENAKRVACGENGELTGTGFINEVMPFIRYRTGDGVTRGGDQCSGCGRHHLLLREIQGRWGQEFLVCRDGHTLISMTSLNLHDDTFDGVTRFQFQQTEPGKVLLKLVTTKTGVAKDAARFHRHFEPKLGHAIELDVRFVDEIPLTRMGKQPMIDQRCPGVSRLPVNSSEVASAQALSAPGPRN